MLTYIYVCALAATLVRLWLRLRLQREPHSGVSTQTTGVARARLTKQASETKRDFFYGYIAS